MKTAKKAANYTPEMEATLKATYNPKADENTRTEQVIQLAEQLGRTAASIRSKLSRMGIYVAKKYVSKTGEVPIQKSELVEEIAGYLGMTSEQCDSLDKANKKVLTAIRDQLKPVSLDEEIGEEIPTLAQNQAE